MKDKDKAEFLRNLRKKYDVTQEEFADIFDIDLQEYKDWESGKSYPKEYMAEMLGGLCDFYTSFGKKPLEKPKNVRYVECIELDDVYEMVCFLQAFFAESCNL